MKKKMFYKIDGNVIKSDKSTKKEREERKER